MKIVITTDSFKASLPAIEVGKSIAKGLRSTYAKAGIDLLPMADGGEGSAEIIAAHLGADKINCQALDPLGKVIDAHWYWFEESNMAILDMASASGYSLVDIRESSILERNTYGTGQLISFALAKGARQIILGMGGSATCDGGLGMAAALGYQFIDAQNGALNPVPANFSLVNGIQNALPPPDCKIVALYDVGIHLLGESGTARRYAAQKGASDNEIFQLEEGLQHLTSLDPNPTSAPGDGAAGGLGYGARTFLNAELKSGFDYIAQITGLEYHIETADLVITGEGKIDSQTLDGKVVSGILQLCKKHKKPLIAVCGQAQSPQIGDTLGFQAIYEIIEMAKNERDAMENASEYLEAIGHTIGNSLK